MTLYFDIETVVNEPAVAVMPDPRAPANYVDPIKIAKFIAEKREDMMVTAPLDPDLGTVRAIGFCETEDEPKDIKVVVIHDIAEETKALQFFWKMFARHDLSIGYNILAFDFPFLMRRSMELKVLVSCRPQLAKYRSFPVLDLYAVLYNWGPGKGLKWVANRYGLEVREPEMDGSMVKDMDDNTVTKYSESSIWVTMQLHKLMQSVYF